MGTPLTENHTTNQMWRLARRPHGEIGDDIFSWHEEPVPELADGEALVRSIYLSVDPTNRIWISDVEGYMPPVGIGEVMRGSGIGEVVASKNPKLNVGDVVQGLFGWQRYAVTNGEGVVPIPKGLPFPLPAFMGVLNHIGATAYFGLMELGRPKAGETVVVSAAAGAVGSLVGQLAKLEGCRVVGICGTDEKCDWLTKDLGFDGAINRRTENIADRLKELCPKGIDVYFDNVGGDILDTCLDQMRLFGRIVLCGLISGYNATELPPGPSNFRNVLIRRLHIQGFIVLDYMDRFMEMAMKLGPLIGTGKLVYKVDLVDGLQHAPKALQRLFSGANTGKLAVKVGDEP